MILEVSLYLQELLSMQDETTGRQSRKLPDVERLVAVFDRKVVWEINVRLLRTAIAECQSSSEWRDSRRN